MGKPLIRPDPDALPLPPAAPDVPYQPPPIDPSTGRVVGGGTLAIGQPQPYSLKDHAKQMLGRYYDLNAAGVRQLDAAGKKYDLGRAILNAGSEPAKTTPAMGGDSPDPRGGLPEEEPAQAPVDTGPGRYGVSGGTVVPAHWQPTTHELGQQTAGTAIEREAQAHAGGEMVQAADQRRQTEAALAHQQGIVDASYLAAKAQASRQFEDDAERLRVQRERYVNYETSKLNDLAQATQAKVDQDQFWKERGTAGNVLGAIALGLGAFGSSLTGGPNTAWQIIQSKVDANIRAQEANINNARGAYQVGTNLFEQNLHAFGDRERALIATRINYLDRVNTELDSALANESLPLKERMNAQQMREQGAKQRVDLMEQFIQHTKTHEQSGERYIPPQMVGGQGRGEPGKENLFIPDLKAYARTPEEAMKIRDHGYRTQVIVKALEDAQNIYAEAQKTSDPRKLYELQQRLEGIKARAAVQQTVKEGQGAMSKGDQAVADKANQLLDGSVYRPNGVLRLQSRLADESKKAAQQEHGRIGTGLLRGEEVYSPDAKGNVVPHRVLEGSNSPTRNTTDNLDDKISPAKKADEPYREKR